MSRIKKQRYVLAVYLFLAALAIIFALIGINYYGETSPIRGLLLNLSTELAGVVLIFFIVNQLFLLSREDDLLAEIRSLKKEAKTRFNPMMSQEEARNSFILTQYLRDAQSVDLLGYTLSSLLKQFREPLVDAIRRGTRVRILLVDATGEAGEIMRHHSNKAHMVDREARAGLEFAQDIERQVRRDNNSRGTVEVRLISWIPSCNMIVVKGDQEGDVAKVGINPPSYRRPAQGRRNLILSRSEHPQDFEYFTSQFDALWNDDGEKLTLQDE